MNRIRTDFLTRRCVCSPESPERNNENPRSSERGRRHSSSNSKPNWSSGGFLAAQVDCFRCEKDEIALRQNASGVYELISDSHKLETGNCDGKSDGFRNRFRGTGLSRA
jgi:hypothetical protein